MRLKKAVGHVVYTPLTYHFSVLEKGGSATQQFDSVLGEFEPDRTLAPFVLQPNLIINDPDGVLQSGDVTSFLVNGVWSVTVVDSEIHVRDVAPSSSTYAVDSVNGYKLTVFMNCGISERIVLKFRADYYDQRRDETQQFTWDKELYCEVQDRNLFNLTVDTGNKTLLSPMRDRGIITINARLMNGEADVTNVATFRWLWWTGAEYIDLNEIDDDTQEVDYYPVWFVDYDQGKLRVRQSAVGDCIIRCEADYGTHTEAKVFRMKRWYGQWEERLDLVSGQFILAGQTLAIADVSVSTRKDVLTDPTKFFDVGIYYSADGVKWDRVCDTEHYEMRSSELTAQDQRFGCLVRELTADIPLVMPDGSPIVAPDGTILTVNVPEEV